MVKSQIFTILSLFAILEAAKLPTYLPQCILNDPNIDECIKKNGNQAIPDIAKGDIHYDIPSVLPLSFPGPIVLRENNQEIVITDLQIHGLQSAKISNVEFKLEKGTYKMIFNIPTITAIASCHAIGNYFGYVVSNHEFLNENLIGASFNYNINFTRTDTDGETYFTNLVHSEKLRAQEQLNEFFPGFGPLKVHKTLCQERFSQIIEQQIGEHLFTIYMNLARRVPLSEIFII